MVVVVFKEVRDVGSNWAIFEEAPVTIEVRWGSATHVGCVRTANQDAVLAGPVIFAVADGMGGHAAGEVASAITVARLALLPANPTGEEVLAAVHEANTEVISQGAPGTGREGMGATLSGVALATNAGREALLIFNVGDSRTYLFDGSLLKQITEDHSLVADMVRAGELGAAEARSHRGRNVITRAIGIAAEVTVDHWWIDPLPGQVFLACSDGLTNEVDVDELAAVLGTAASPQQAVDVLVERALDAGARDNVSAIAVFLDAVTNDIAVIEEDTNPTKKRGALVSPAPEVIDTVPGPRADDGPGPSFPGDLVTGVPLLERDGRDDGVPADLGSEGQGR